MHNPGDMKQIDRLPYDPDKPLPRTITCSGGQNYHYSGTRDYTEREYAALNGFPRYHDFVAPCIKKQIGNAFPPVVVKVLYDHLRQWLEREDNVDRSSVAEIKGPELLFVASQTRESVASPSDEPDEKKDGKAVPIVCWDGDVMVIDDSDEDDGEAFEGLRQPSVWSRESSCTITGDSSPIVLDDDLPGLAGSTIQMAIDLT